MGIEAGWLKLFGVGAVNPAYMNAPWASRLMS